MAENILDRFMNIFDEEKKTDTTKKIKVGKTIYFKDAE